MNFRKQPPILRMIFVSATALLCLLLSSVMAQIGSSHGLLRKKPSVELQASTTLITYPCPPSDHSLSGSCPSIASLQVGLTAITEAFNKQADYLYRVTGGRVVGEGRKVTWDLSEVGPGVYTATVEVQDNKKHRALSSVEVTIRNCRDCVISDWCPLIMVTCYDQVKAGTPVTCKVAVAPWLNAITLEWSVRDSNGENLSGRISRRDRYISVRTEGLGGLTITATVEVNGLDPHCPRTASSYTVVKP